jgi:hypothetical protein
VLLSKGSQRYFHKVIRMLQPRHQRKTTFVNLDRIRCLVQDICGYTPSDETIWRSIHSVTLQRLTCEFLWKCKHNTFRVGDFWYHIETLEIYGRCHAFGVPETLEHIALECDASGQKLIWGPTRRLWSKKYSALLGEADILSSQMLCSRSPAYSLASYAGTHPTQEDWIIAGFCAYVPQVRMIIAQIMAVDR